MYMIGFSIGHFTNHFLSRVTQLRMIKQDTNRCVQIASEFLASSSFCMVVESFGRYFLPKFTIAALQKVIYIVFRMIDN